MIKKIFITLLMTIFSFNAFSEKVEIQLIASDGEKFTCIRDTENPALVLANTEKFNPRHKKIVEIHGLEKFEKITAFENYFIDFDGDFSFLEKFPNLKRLGMTSNFKNLAFLQNLPNLEIVDLTCYVKIQDKEQFENKTIDLQKLTNLNKFYLSVVYIDEKLPSKNKVSGRLTHIPPFTNVQNKPELYVTDQHISALSKNDEEYMKQYSKVDLNYNPITKK